MNAGAQAEVECKGALGRVRRRMWPIVATALVLVTGMAYSLWWGSVVRHTYGWIPSGDIWGAYRSAHFVAWGAFGSVYAAGTSLVTFPGILLLFAPAAALTGHFGMTESFPLTVPHPTAWFVLGPYEILIGCSVLFACDALAERLAVSASRRMVLCIVEGVALWPVVVIWGHPEDALAVALAVWSLLFAVDDRWTGAGWLFGAAVATQPLVLLVLPVLLARAGLGRARGLIVRSVVPGALLIATPLMASFHDTVHALVDQPNYPRIDHATPWTFLAPRLGGQGVNVAVAAGPGRIVAILAACGLGFWARRWRHQPEMIVWAAALAFALRCFTESVMDSFYVWPPLALALLVAARRPSLMFLLAMTSTVGVTVCSENHLGAWPWWALVSGGIALTLVASIRSRSRSSRPVEDVPIDLHTAGVDAVEDSSRVFVGATP